MKVSYVVSKKFFFNISFSILHVIVCSNEKSYKIWSTKESLTLSKGFLLHHILLQIIVQTGLPPTRFTTNNY